MGMGHHRAISSMDMTNVFNLANMPSMDLAAALAGMHGQTPSFGISTLFAAAAAAQQTAPLLSSSLHQAPQQVVILQQQQQPQQEASPQQPPLFDQADASRQMAEWGSDRNKKASSRRQERQRLYQSRRACVLQLAERLFNAEELQEMHAEVDRLSALYREKANAAAASKPRAKRQRQN